MDGKEYEYLKDFILDLDFKQYDQHIKKKEKNYEEMSIDGYNDPLYSRWGSNGSGEILLR